MLKNKLLIVASILLVSASSCNKFCGPIPPPPSGENDTHCQVTKIDITGYYLNTDEYLFYYNAKGNPDSVIDITPEDNVGNPRQFFRYDQHGRLSDYMWTNQKSSSTGGWFAINWHKYAYPKPDFVTDTVIDYGGDVRGPAPIAAHPHVYTINGYTLDAKGRITNIWNIPIDTPHTPVLIDELTYDANGNLPLPGPGFLYDDKVNFYRTNKVWQFVYRNYSHNNLIRIDSSIVTTYNDAGLPLHMPTMNPLYEGAFGVLNVAPALGITYACSMPKGPINY